MRNPGLVPEPCKLLNVAHQERYFGYLQCGVSLLHCVTLLNLLVPEDGCRGLMEVEKNVCIEQLRGRRSWIDISHPIIQEKRCVKEVITRHLNDLIVQRGHQSRCINVFGQTF